MGLPIVLLMWLVVGLVVAGVGAVVLISIARVLTRRVTAGRRRIVVAAGLLPFICLGWEGCVFVVQAIVNEGFLRRDLGLGDTWHAPLPNGYQVMMIDVTDQGWVYNPKTQPSESVIERQDAVPGVRNLQLAGRYILGGTDSKGFEHLGQEANQIDGYFILDTQSGKRTQFQSYDALRNSARELNVEVNLKPINEIYSNYRFTWFDIFVGCISCLPPIIGIILLFRWIFHLRRIQRLAPDTPSVPMPG